MCPRTSPIAFSQRERRLPVTLLRLILWLFFRIFYRARWLCYGRVPASGPVIIAPNHGSFFDPPLVNVPIWRRARFFTNERYFKFPLGPIIRYLGAFPVDLTRRFDTRAYHHARRVLEQGGLLMLFPEGTRSSDGLLGKIQPGVAALALETGATIVPVSVCGTFDAWPRTRRFPRFCRPISVKYHEPIRVERIGDPQLRRQKIAEINRRISRALAPRLRAWHTVFHSEGTRPPQADRVHWGTQNQSRDNRWLWRSQSSRPAVASVGCACQFRLGQSLTPLFRAG
ncbi:1-acyl-sn-glycerol-3-phosphate acyltransferase [Candidatus Sumerlaeota bacterium]|nr:1-acyl-sn-glycerol-3-phosphate acyltransferase [Candidatus Sumerlaeota bacterium]